MKVKAIGLFALLMIAFFVSPRNAAAWCDPGIVYCGTVIDSNTTQGHDDTDRYPACTGTTRYRGNLNIYKIDHTGGQLWITLEWLESSDADEDLHLFLLGSCNTNTCLAHDPHYLEGNLPAGDYWILVEGKSNEADGKDYRLSIFCGDTPFSVALISFAAQPVEGGIQLNWATASETDNDRFDIDRRPTGDLSWTAVGSVQGQGTSAGGQNYSFVDNTVSGGTWDYRLCSVDVSGNREEIGFVIVTASAHNDAIVEDMKLVGNFPNPFNPTTTIQFQVGEAMDISLDVFDVNGRLIRTLASGSHAVGTHEVQFDGADLASGVYFARLTSPVKSEIMKMVLMK